MEKENLHCSKVDKRRRYFMADEFRKKPPMMDGFDIPVLICGEIINLGGIRRGRVIDMLS